MDLIRALQVELPKLRRTLALWMVVIAPVSVVFLMTLNLINAGRAFLPEGHNPWLFLATNSIGLWALLMLPLFVSLETALIGSIEHGNQTWKHIFALPISRSTFYIAKQIIIMGLIAISTVVLITAVLIAVMIVNGLGWIPRADMQAPIPWMLLVVASVCMYFASWLIVAVHTWVGIRWHNFTVSLGFGIVATVSAFIIANAEQGYYFPWAMPARVAIAFTVPDTGIPILTLIGLSIVGALLVTLPGAMDIHRRDIV